MYISTCMYGTDAAAQCYSHVQFWHLHVGGKHYTVHYTGIHG